MDKPQDKSARNREPIPFNRRPKVVSIRSREARSKPPGKRTATNNNPPPNGNDAA